MQVIDVAKRRIGVNFCEEGKASVCVWAPEAKRVTAVTANEKISLEKTAYGYWQAHTNKITKGSKYHLQLDANEPLPDPASLSQPEGVHGPSEAVDLADHQWKAGEWNNIPLEDYIIYELHVGTYTKEGTFNSLIKKLDHLKELGITAIELMPVAQFSGERNWGYDGVFPFAVQHSYGGSRGLQQLVDACHQKGLAVILDVVYNHLGPEGNYFHAYGPYFTDKHHTPWGNALNFDDAWCDGVRQYFIENAIMWFRDFRVDALRLDAVHAIKDLSPVHLLKELRCQANAYMKHTNRRHYLMVESDLNDPKFITPLEKGGYEMDAQWNDEFHHALRVTAGQERTGYYSDFTGIEHLAKAYKDAYVYDGQFSPHRKKFFGIPAKDAGGKQFVVFSQNHDHVGNRMLGERLSRLVSYEMQKLLAAAVIVSPYLPMLFMGEEWSETNPFQYFVSHTDPELAEDVRKGRKEEFAAFHLDGKSPDPMAEETFNRSRLQWDLLKEEKHSTMFAYYKNILALRKKTKALSSCNRKALEVHFNKETNSLSLKRWQNEEQVLCLMNFSDTTNPVHIENITTWQVLLNSAASEWKGPGEAPLDHDSICLQAESIVILKTKTQEQPFHQHSASSIH